MQGGETEIGNWYASLPSPSPLILSSPPSQHLLSRQARKKSAAGDETGMQLNMAMARRMMERVFDDDTFKMSREGLRLYIMILEAVGAQQEILNVLDRDAGVA